MVRSITRLKIDPAVEFYNPATNDYDLNKDHDVYGVGVHLIVDVAIDSGMSAAESWVIRASALMTLTATLASGCNVRRIGTITVGWKPTVEEVDGP